jgi:hypothetical protein
VHAEALGRLEKLLGRTRGWKILEAARAELLMWWWRDTVLRGVNQELLPPLRKRGPRKNQYTAAKIRIRFESRLSEEEKRARLESLDQEWSSLEALYEYQARARKHAGPGRPPAQRAFHDLVAGYGLLLHIEDRRPHHDDYRDIARLLDSPTFGFPLTHRRVKEIVSKVKRTLHRQGSVDLYPLSAAVSQLAAFSSPRPYR